MTSSSESPVAHLPGTAGPFGKIGDRARSLLRSAWSGLRRRSQGYAWFVLGASVVTQLLVVLLLDVDPEIVRSRFVSETRVLALAGVGISMAAFVAPGRRSYWAVSALRALVTVALVGSVREADTIVHVLVLTPVLVEMVTYERLVPAIVVDSIIMLCYIAFQVFASDRALLHIMLSGSTSALIAALAAWIKYYRESVVDQSKRVANLQGAFEQLTDSNLGLQIYATNAENESATKERTRITRELHDSVGYALTNIAMMMKASQVLLERDPEKLRSMLTQAQELANEALGEARGILYKLRRVNDQSYQGLWAISRLVKAYRLATGVDVEVHYGNVEWSLGREIDAVIYRLVQEGLTNAYRHGGATRVRITMWMSDNETVVQIWDNGQGASVVHEGIGLAGMRERFAEFGGSIEAGNTVDGFEVKGRIPWKKEAH